jgi:hypothetical protein
VKAKEVRLHEFLFVVFLNRILYLNKLLNSLSVTKATHILLKVTILALILFEFGGLIIRQNPREDEELVQITVGPATEDI